MRYSDIIGEAARKKPTGPHLTFADAVDFIRDLHTRQDRILAVTERNPWMREMSQEAARERLGASFPVFRAISVWERDEANIRPEGVVSTSPDMNGPLQIAQAHQYKAYMTGGIFSSPSPDYEGARILQRRVILLRYDITPERVVCWVPLMFDYLLTALGGRANQSVYPGTKGVKTLGAMVRDTRRSQENEMLVDATGLTPTVLDFKRRDDFYRFKHWYYNGTRVDDPTHGTINWGPNVTPEQEKAYWDRVQQRYADFLDPRKGGNPNHAAMELPRRNREIPERW